MKKLEKHTSQKFLKMNSLKPMGLTAYKLTQAIGVPQTRTSQIIKGRRRITADTALRLAKFFGTSSKFWLGLQNDFDIEEEQLNIKKELNLIEKMN